MVHIGFKIYTQICRQIRAIYRLNLWRIIFKDFNGIFRP